MDILPFAIVQIELETFKVNKLIGYFPDLSSATLTCSGLISKIGGGPLVTFAVVESERCEKLFPLEELYVPDISKN